MTHEYGDDRQRQLISIVKAKSTSTHIPEKMFDMALARARRRYKEADKGGVERGTRAAVVCCVWLRWWQRWWQRCRGLTFVAVYPYSVVGSGD